MAEFPLHFLLQGVPAIETPNGYLIIDTGSPSTFTRDGRLELSGQSLAVRSSFLSATPDYLSQQFDCTIYGVVGMDWITGWKLHLDYDAGRLIIGPEAEKLGVSESVRMLQGVARQPIIEVLLPDGAAAKALIDTGAHISYAQSAFCRHLRPIGKVDDFNPFLGHLRNNFYSSFSYRMASRHYSHNIAEAGGELGATLSAYSIDLLLGFDFFSQAPLTLDFPNAQLLC